MSGLPAEGHDEGLHTLLPHIWSPLDSFFVPHPQYFSLAGDFLTELFYGQGPLKKSERHFIAVMTASSSHCDFLVNLHQREFEREGGDPQWLTGLAHVDDKRFKAIDDLVTYISHQPWRVNADVLQKLCRNMDGVLWSLNQLVHAACVIATTQSLCTFVLGLGEIEPTKVSSTELDNLARRCEWLARDRVQESAAPRTASGKQEVAYLLDRMSMLREAAKEQDEMADDEGVQKKNWANFQQLAKEAAVTDENAMIPRNETSPHIYTLLEPFTYVDFALRTDPSKTFKIHEFGWDIGFSIIDDIYPSLATKLDNKCHLMQSLTYNTMGSFTNVDTSEYRLAIWNYIQALFGIRHDDYDYAQVNEMLSREMKTFVKTAVCFPQRLTEQLRTSVMAEFDISEKLHVLLLIVEARAQASLLYFTRALTNYYVVTNRRR